MTGENRWRSAWWFGWLLGAGILGPQPGVASEPRRGRVVDPEGGPVAGAEIRSMEGEWLARSGLQGSFEIRIAGEVPLRLRVTASGFRERQLEVDPTAKAPDGWRIVLEPETHGAEITVLGRRLISGLDRAEEVPGSYDALSREDVERSQVRTTHEALRKLPGLFARDEEGLGLRPNVGLRGILPTRSTKLLLLEDGLPLAYAPYGDNASYYHPPIERFEAVELLKGSAQIAYGPQTVGGAINYLTPVPPARFSGSLALALGTREFEHVRGRAGSSHGPLGWWVDLGRKASDGSRENTHTLLEDGNLKISIDPSAGQSLNAKLSHYRERSQLTYSGLRQAEWEADPRQNPFRNDSLDFQNLSGALSHTLVLGGRSLLETAAYGSRFSRDWWRQSSNSNQRPNDAGDPACAGMENLNTTCGNEGRLRDYETWGLSSRLTWPHALLGQPAELVVGARFHREEQERLQKNGPLPTSRDGVLVENNRRDAEAVSGFLQYRLRWRNASVTPGVRFESIDYLRTNRLAAAGRGITGTTSTRVLLPGLGVSWRWKESATLFAGVHRGFSPPRVEDILSNTGGVVELDPELAWNYELGLRSRPRPGVNLSATLFSIDYENQIVPASVAGGIGAALTNGGATRHEGLEGWLLLEAQPLFGSSAPDLFLRLSGTWLPTAEFRGVRRSAVPGFQAASVSGNRLPYAPGALGTATLAYRHPRGMTAELEAVYTGSMVADDLNSRIPSADGQRGPIPAHWLMNAALTVEVPRWKSRIHLAVKNLEDRTVIVDRSRGLLPSMPRTVQVGWKLAW